MLRDMSASRSTFSSKVAVRGVRPPIFAKDSNMLFQEVSTYTTLSWPVPSEEVSVVYEVEDLLGIDRCYCRINLT